MESTKYIKQTVCYLTSVLAFLAALAPSAAEEKKAITISVFDKNFPDVLVPATLRVVTVQDGATYYFSGSQDSIHPKKAFCNQGQAVVAEPDNKAYYFKSKNYDCAFPLSISLDPKYDFAYIVTKATGFYESGDFGKSALLYSEAASQASAIGLDSTYSDLAKKTYLSAGKVLGVDRVIVTPAGDPAKFWMSTDLKSTIEKYQAGANIAVTGKLDYSTLHNMSGTDIGKYLYCPPSCGGV